MDPLQKYLIDSLINPNRRREDEPNFSGRNYRNERNFSGRNYRNERNVSGRSYGNGRNGGRSYGNERNFSGRSYGNGRNGGRYNNNNPYSGSGMEQRRGGDILDRNMNRGDNQHRRSDGRSERNLAGNRSGGIRDTEIIMRRLNLEECAGQLNEHTDRHGKPIDDRNMNRGDKEHRRSDGRNERNLAGNRGGDGRGSVARKRAGQLNEHRDRHGKPIDDRNMNRGDNQHRRSDGRNERNLAGNRGGDGRGSVASKRKQKFEIFKLKKKVQRQQQIIQQQKEESENQLRQKSHKNIIRQQVLQTNPPATPDAPQPVPVRTSAPVATTATPFVPEKFPTPPDDATLPVPAVVLIEPRCDVT